jgi:hypothetical protein
MSTLRLRSWRQRSPCRARACLAFEKQGYFAARSARRAEGFRRDFEAERADVSARALRGPQNSFFPGARFLTFSGRRGVRVSDSTASGIGVHDDAENPAS